MPPKIIAVTTHKGGTGKTVTSMALSAGLALTGERCLLVDLDPQGHSTIGLGVSVNHGEPTVSELFTEPPKSIQTLIRPTTVEGLEIVPATMRLATVAQNIAGRVRRHEALKKALEPIQRKYRFIVIDCPPSLGTMTENAVYAATFIVVPCLMEARAADGLVDLLEHVYVVKGKKFEDWGILMTRVDSRKTLTNEAVTKALERWKHKIFKTIIPPSEPLNQAQMARTDIYHFEPGSRGALAYRSFTEEILRYGKQTETSYRQRRGQRAHAERRQASY